MSLNKKYKNKSGFSLLEMVFVILILCMMTALISVGMGLSNGVFKKTIRNAEARTLASAVNSIISDELSYAADIRLYKFRKSSFEEGTSQAGFETYTGLSDGSEVIVYTSLTQGDLTFFACPQTDVNVSASNGTTVLSSGRLYFYSGTRTTDGSGDNFNYSDFTVNAMVPATAYSYGCYVSDFNIVPISASGSALVANSAKNSNLENWDNILDIDYFDVSYKIVCIENGSEQVIIDEHFQVENLQ